MRHRYVAGAIYICSGSWKVFLFNLFDFPFNFIVRVSFKTKYAHLDKSDDGLRIMYRHPTIYEKPSSFFITDGGVINFGSKPERSKYSHYINEIWILQYIPRELKERNLKFFLKSPRLCQYCSIKLKVAISRFLRVYFSKIKSMK